VTGEGPVVVYRDRSSDPNEIRDISIVRLNGQRWTDPRPVALDRWELTGCPVNGPAIAARGREVAVAWYTGAGDAPRVKLAFSRDAGESFASPVTIDDGSPIGRVDLLLLEDGSALVCWLEKAAGGGSLRLRRVKPGGAMEQSSQVAPSGTARSNGFPQMVRQGESVLFAWTAAGIKTARLELSPR
jgi:hypothetical protein